jgi:hypothetical protein
MHTDRVPPQPPSFPSRRPVVLLTAALATLVVGSFLVVRLSGPKGAGPGGRAGEPDGKDKKVWSGKSYAQVTRVEAAPVPSAAAPGRDSERVRSGEDDWEPAAAHPGAGARPDRSGTAPGFTWRTPSPGPPGGAVLYSASPSDRPTG